MNWKIGDTAICLFDKDFPPANIKLVKGKEYIIKNILTCRCGRVALDIGARLIMGAGMECVHCGNRIRTSIMWADEKLFTKPKEDFAEETLANVLELAKQEELNNPVKLEPEHELVNT